MITVLLQYENFSFMIFMFLYSVSVLALVFAVIYTLPGLKYAIHNNHFIPKNEPREMEHLRHLFTYKDNIYNHSSCPYYSKSIPLATTTCTDTLHTITTRLSKMSQHYK